MPLTIPSAWPDLVDGRKAKASEVEQKFDWLEGAQIPMLNGNPTASVYDLGSATYPWRNVYADQLVIGGFTVTSKMAGYGLKAYGTIRGTTIETGYNIDSVTYPATGTYSVVWTTPFSSADYAVMATTGPNAFGVSTPAYAVVTVSNMSAGGVTISGFNFSGAAQGLYKFYIMATGD